MNITLYVEVEWYLCAHLFLYLVQAQGSRDGEHLDAGLYLPNFISNEQYEVKLIRQVANKVFLENETWKKRIYDQLSKNLSICASSVIFATLCWVVEWRGLPVV